MRDGWKSYYEKLRRVMYFLFYVTDSSKAMFRMHVFPKLLGERQSVGTSKIYSEPSFFRRPYPYMF